MTTNRAAWWYSPVAFAVYVFLLIGAVYAPELAALCGYGELDCTTRKLRRSQSPDHYVSINGDVCTVTGSGTSTCTVTAAGGAGGVLVLPNATTTLTGTQTVTQTDIGTTTATAGAIPIAGTDGKLDIGWIPTQRYLTAYEVDYTALGNQSLTTGAVTIDGRVCYVSNSANAGTFTVGSSSGGLYIRTNATSSNDAGTTVTAPIIGCAINTVGGNGLVDFSPSALSREMWVWVMSNPNTTFTAASDRAIVGVSYNSVTTGQITNLGFRVRQTFLWNVSCTNNHCQHYQQNSFPNTSSDGLKIWQQDSTPVTDVSVFHMRGFHVDNYYGTSTAGAWPARTALTYSGASDVNNPSLSGGVSSTAHYPTVFYGAAGQNTNANASILVKKLKIEHLQIN